jgi:hypothetical protein
MILFNFRSTHIFEWEHQLVCNIWFLVWEKKERKKKVKFSIQVPIKLGYDNYFTNEVVGLGSQFMWRARDTICRGKETSAHCQQIIFVTHELWEPFNSLFCVQVNCNDKPIETQHFSENEDQNHSYKEAGLLGCPADAGVADDTYGEPGGQTAESYGQPRAQVNKPPENKNKWYIAVTHLTFILSQ